MPENLIKQEKTKQKLSNALIDLCNEKGYYNTTIDDICKRAETYRSTFYRYYDNKDTLLREIEQKYIITTKTLAKTLYNFYLSPDKENNELYKQELILCMEYHQRNKQFFKFLLSPIGDPSFAKNMRKQLKEGIEKSLKKHGVYLGKNQKYIITFLTNGYIMTVYEWLKNDDRSAEEIASLLLTILTSVPYLNFKQ